MRNLLFSFFFISSLWLMSGCGTHQIKAGGSGYSAPAIGDSKDYCIPALPAVTVADVVTADQIESFLWREFPGVQVEQLADNQYAILTRESVLNLIGYIPAFSDRLGLYFVDEGFDCDNFAKLWSQGAQMALWLSYGDAIAAQTLVSVIYVEQTHSWGGVPQGGAHALNAIAAWGPDGLEIIVVEPQGGTWTTNEFYPNYPYKIKIE